MAHRHGGEITHPRFYEFGVTIGLLGFRRWIYDGLVRLSGAAPGQDVLDIGCGTGYFTKRAAKVIGEDGRAVGIDPSAPMIDYASRHKTANSEFVVAGAEKIPQPDASFDLVISSIAIHHIPHEHRAAAMAEMHRVLRPGGRLFIADFRGGAEPLREFITNAGFSITGEGDHRPFLHYFQAAR